MKSLFKKLFLIAVFLLGLFAALAVQDAYFPSKEAIRARKDAEYVRSIEKMIEHDRQVLNSFHSEDAE